MHRALAFCLSSMMISFSANADKPAEGPVSCKEMVDLSADVRGADERTVRALELGLYNGGAGAAVAAMGFLGETAEAMEREGASASVAPTDPEVMSILAARCAHVSAECDPLTVLIER